MPKKKPNPKVEAELTEQMFNRITRLAKKKKSTKAHIIREALRVYLYLR